MKVVSKKQYEIITAYKLCFAKFMDVWRIIGYGNGNKIKLWSKEFTKLVQREINPDLVVKVDKSFNFKILYKSEVKRYSFITQLKYIFLSITEKLKNLFLKR